MIPAWLQRTLGDVHRAAGLRTCPRCNSPILTGLDADMCALTARTDLLSVNAMGETLALLTGRRTFDLITVGGRKELHRRDECHIKAERTYPVLPEHKCGAALDAHTEKARPRRRYVIPNEPPY